MKVRKGTIVVLSELDKLGEVTNYKVKTKYNSKSVRSDFLAQFKSQGLEKDYIELEFAKYMVNRGLVERYGDVCNVSINCFMSATEYDSMEEYMSKWTSHFLPN